MTYPFRNFDGAAVEVWEWISNFIPYFTANVITYPCYGYKQSLSVKGTRGVGSIAVSTEIFYS